MGSTESTSLYDTPSSQYILREWYKHMRRNIDESTTWDCYLLLQDPLKRESIWKRFFIWWREWEWDELTGLQMSVWFRLLEVVKVFIKEAGKEDNLHESGDMLLNSSECLDSV